METVTDMKGNIVKMEEDYTETCDKQIPEAESMADSGNLLGALEALLSLEKLTRTAADMLSTGRVMVSIMKMCFAAKNLDLLNEHLVILTKRRGQLKQAVTKMVQEAVTYLPQIDSKEETIKLIDTLRTVTAGKIYLELERARITRQLAELKEADGDVDEAANILQELQVETYGSMEKKEKVDFILEQIRLCLAKKDYIRTQIISKKISTKFFESDNEQDLKLKYYQLMIELAVHEGKYLPICRHYRAVFDTPKIAEDEAKRTLALKNVVMYSVLAEYDHEQADFLTRTSQEPRLEEIPVYEKILKCFTTLELIHWVSFCGQYEEALRKGTATNEATGVFDDTEKGNKAWENLRKRVVEHNIRIMEKYYSRISMKRMAVLLDLSPNEAEKFLSELVTRKTVFAKIDRPAGIVVFRRSAESEDTLNGWARDTDKVMELINKTMHLITKEQMVHQLIH